MRSQLLSQDRQAPRRQGEARAEAAGGEAQLQEGNIPLRTRKSQPPKKLKLTLMSKTIRTQPKKWTTPRTNEAACEAHCLILAQSPARPS